MKISIHVFFLLPLFLCNWMLFGSREQISGQTLKPTEDIQNQKKDKASTNPVGVPYAVRLQILLDRAGFSSGEIDGSPASNLRKASSAFQQAHGLSPVGRSDEATLKALLSVELTESLVNYTISNQDAAGPFNESIPKDLIEQSKLTHLGYTSILEGLGEKFHSAPALLRSLNPGANFQAGDTIVVPNVFQLPDDASTRNGSARKPRTGSKDGYTIIVTERTSDVVLKDPDGEILFHAPATVGSERDRLPVGNWQVTGVKRNPVFFYNPKLFWDEDPSHAKATILPGPNNPVGLVWIGLNAKSYGLHGTPEPGKIGHSESHGCVRLTNWDALRLAALIEPGTEVIFQQ
jgi:lipoprotein-anchoring transpeptidase ErfK/SrfK